MRRAALIIFSLLSMGLLLLVTSPHLLAQTDDAPFPPGTRYFLQAFVDDGERVVYEGEQVVYVLRTYVLSQVRIQTNSLQILPAFDGFWQSIALELRDPLIEVIHGQQYVVLETYVLLYPLQTGMLTIEPARLELPETTLQNAEEYDSNPVSIEVLPLPQPIPAGFSGAVGQFRLELTLEPAEITLGEPITLVLTVTGAGNLEQVPSPPLTIPDGWRVFENDTSQDFNVAVLLWSRRYEYLLVPHQAGTVALSPVAFVYFDPVSEAYVTLDGAEYVVDILPGSDGVRSLESRAEVQAVFVPELLPVDAAPGGVSSRPFWWMWMFPPLIVAVVMTGCGLLGWRRRRLIAYRKVNALKRALRCVESAPDEGGFVLIQQAVVGYCWDKLGYLPDQRSDDTLISQLEAASDASLVEQVQALLIYIDTARYAPVALRPRLDQLVRQVISRLQAIERDWGRV